MTDEERVHQNFGLDVLLLAFHKYLLITISYIMHQCMFVFFSIYAVDYVRKHLSDPV